MAVHREDGSFSAHCEAFLIIDGQEVRLAKTNHKEVVLAAPREIAPNTEAELRVHVDSYVGQKRVVLLDGATLDRAILQYSVLAPF